MEFVPLCCIAIGGALGACSRFGLSILATTLFGKQFPWGTLGVNVAGSFLAGVLAGLAAAGSAPGHLWMETLTRGYLGALTTFSSFSLDTFTLFRQGKNILALVNILLNLLLCLAGTAAGFFLAGGTP